ncbi:MAG: hypothetical protein FWD31_07445 [Planctomycetaceae bacterium]|nr:hypothetical protein [Planctomycetaceae bacterium]
MKYYLGIVLLVTAVAMTAGCGPKRPPTAKVNGTVTYQGKPLATGTIIFEVDDARPATGKIVDGNIVDVTTFDKNDGVSIGLAKIAIVAREEVEEIIADTGDPSAARRPPANYMGIGGRLILPPHYGNPSTSQLTATIEKGKENTIDLVLE